MLTVNRTHTLTIKNSTSNLYPQALASQLAERARHGFVTVEYFYVTEDNVLIRGRRTEQALAGPILNFYHSILSLSGGCAGCVVGRPLAATMGAILRNADWIEHTTPERS